ncbi:MAG: hypothetical protein A2Y38_09230 [Spirochaetes bacterium GWB1_59_5]|nr:MAG: hypothetical protein A2Y38_09230 [Spirochaetes bacterium GWB1_59_5]
METRETGDEKKATVGRLSMEAIVVLASTTLSADDVDRQKRAGTLTLSAPASQAAYLEAGGVIVAEGIMRKKHGKSAFVVTRTYQDANEVRS